MKASTLITLGMWMLGILGSYSMAAYGQASCTLASGGQPLMPVIVSANANASVIESAWELADYLGRITGSGFSVEVGDGATGIAVGMPSDFPALQADPTLHLAERFSAANDILYAIQSYVLQSRANGIVVIGGSELGVEYAVWDLLYKLGYRKFFPGDAWEVIPSLPNASLTADAFEKPNYVDRRIWYGFGGDVVRQRDWNFRNRMSQCGSINWRFSMPSYLKSGMIDTTEGYGNIISINQAAFDAHHEYYALVGGQRVVSSLSKLCISNPDVQQMALAAARYMFDVTPDLHHFSVSMEPSDGGYWCECANCVALGTPSTRLAVLANYVATGLETTHPDKWVGIMSYNENADPPAINVHPRVWVACATTMILGTNILSERLQGWLAKGAGGAGIYDYWGLAQWWGFLPAQGLKFSYMGTNIPEYCRLGARSMNAESGEIWGAKGLDFYIASRLLWSTNEATNVQALTDDFLAKAFGPAAEPMRNFYALLDIGKLVETGGLPTDSPDYFKDRYTKMYAALLWAADAAGNDLAIQARLDDLFLYTRFVQLFDEWFRAAEPEKQAKLEQMVLFAYRIRETGMAHWNGVLNTVSGAGTVDLTPPPSCVTPALKAEARAAAVLVTANSPVHTQLPNGLVAHWMLDETSGITAADASGNDNAGALVGGPTWTSAGKIGGALYFDGINDYVDLGDKFNPRSSSWTVALWFKAEAGGGWLYNNACYEARVGAGNFYYAWQPYWVSEGGTSFPVTAGQWHHATVVYDKTNQYLYKDGALVYSRPQTGDIGSSAYRLLLGACNSMAPYGFFTGALDDVRIYNKALTAAEVAAVAAINQENRIPVAANNTYTTAEDTPLTVTAPGVLGNDSDADGDTLTATKYIDPANGKYGADHGLVLNANGSFTYTPRKDWIGTDSFTYRVSDNRGAATQAVVTITVTPINDAPECSITNPVNGATFPAPAAIMISADALDVDGTVTKVEFYNGAAKLGEVATSPYNFAWNNVAIGNYTLTAKATDNSGATKTSVPVNVAVVQPNALPTCSITSPTTGAAFIAPATITINATAADSDGSIAKVELYNGTVKLHETLSSPCSYTWPNMPVGGYAFIAKATDNRGAVKTSAVVNVTVNNTIGTDGLVAYWMLDETFGTTAADSTGNGNAGTLVNGPLWAGTGSGKIGGALYLDGVNDYVDIGNKLNPGTNNWTVALWFKSYAAGGFLYDKGNLYQALSGGGYFKYAWRPHWVSDGDTSFPVMDGQWCHSAVVYDKTNQYVYKNGVLVYSRQQTGDIGSSAYHLLLGACNSDAPAGFFTGVLDDVRIYNKALSAAEVAVLASMGQANGAPTCYISSPLNGATFTAPVTITINAIAADSDGSITKVEFYNGAVKLGEDATSPYSFAWNNVAAGSYALTVRATDNSGTMTTSAVVNVTVNGAANGLIAHWMLDETSGTTATDASGNGNAGTLINGPTWTSAGKIGGALYFDGINDYVYIGNNLNPGSSSWTVALWFKAEVAGGWLYNNGGYEARVGGGYFYYAWLPHWVSDGDTSFPVTAGQWHHAAVVYDKANQYLYKDGVLVYSRPQTGDIGSSAYRLLLGACNSAAPYGFFNGLLDDVRIYSNALTAAEITTLASMGQGNVAPTCSISSPTDGATFTAPASITINANASDSDGSVTKVEFYNGAAKLGEDLSAPYSLVTNNVAAGSYALTVRATDNSGMMTTSAVVNVMVNGTANGLIAHWMLDETSGTTAADASGNGNVGTLVGGPTWTSAGKIGGALYFDGINDYVYIGNNLNPGSSSWTVALWFKSEVAGGWLYNNGGYEARVGGGYFYYAWLPHWVSDGGTSFPVTSGQWHHAAVVYDKTNQYLYKGGVLVYSRPQTGDIGSSAYRLLLGACNSDAPYGFFNGLLDDVRIYSKALTASEVAELVEEDMEGMSPPNDAPTCSISSPANGTTFTAPASITINANASDNDGAVAKVEFYNGATKLGEDLTSPYSLVTNNAAAGSYALTVRAMDDEGAVTTSVVANVTVNPPANVAPTCSITNPLNGATFSAPASITINAIASDSDGTVTKVEFYNGVVKWGEDLSSPYSLVTNNVAAGSYALTVRATDNSGAITTSAVVNVTAVGLPSPWTAQNIGAVGLAGDTIYNSGTFTNKGAGTNIAGTVDAFRYVQQVTSGDCELKLRVASISNTSSRAKAGVMIRGSLTANAMEAGVWVTPSSGIVFTYRTSNGGSTTTSTSSGKVAPYWVRITRTSNSFKAYYSSNGTSWTQLGSTRTISMPTSAYMGMGTCSGNTNLLCISAMDNVTATP